jgi:hypothetical protein
MGLITGLLTLPLAPVRGTAWVAELLLDEAERQLDDPVLLEGRLEEAERRLEAGEISQDELDAIEEDVVLRLMRGGKR